MKIKNKKPFPYRIYDRHYIGKNRTHVEVEHRDLLCVGRIDVDHVEVVVVDARDPDHQHGGDDQAGVVQGESQQQSVHGTRHRGSEEETNIFNCGWFCDIDLISLSRA